MHCVVCWEATSERLGPCDHALCRACARKWLPRNPSCPYCRADTYGLSPVAPASTSKHPPACRTIRVPLDDGTHAGITLENVGAGVRVRSLRRRDQCMRHGVRTGMIIRAINDIECTEHALATRMIDAATKAGGTLVVDVLRERRRTSFSSQMTSISSRMTSIASMMQRLRGVAG